MRCEKCSCRFEDKDDLTYKRFRAFVAPLWFEFPKSDEYARKHRDWDSSTGKIAYDNWSGTSIGPQHVYAFYEYVDHYDGEKILARVNIEEREWIRGKWNWLRKILKHFPNCRTIRRDMCIEFKDEVGGRKGSWKGGTLGMGYAMLPGESLDSCWKRFAADKNAVRG